MKVIGLKIKVKVNDKTEMKLQASLIAISVIFLKAINQNAMFVPKWACMGGAVDCKTCGRSGNRT